MPKPLFIFGTLLDPDLRAAVLGVRVPARPATLPGRRVMRVEGETFPTTVSDPGAVAEGALLDLDAEQLARVEFFEGGVDYGLIDATALEDGRPVAARMFASGVAASEQPWDLAAWARTEKPFFLECAAEIMGFFQAGARRPDPALWPGVRSRARARAIAAATPRRSPAGFGRDDVETIDVARPYAGFFAVEEHRLRHPRFAGGRTPELLRAVIASGDAVAVLPYDPARDAVLLLTQWRAGPHARGDRAPWPVETVAGRIDRAETPEQVARREAAEEAGLALGRMERVAGYYPSPGSVAEFVTVFVAEADLSAGGGVHGAAEEDEDILTLVLPFDEALAMADREEIDSSTALIALLHLARRRDRLRRAWAAR